MRREYPGKVIQFARRLHDAGRGIEEIRQLLIGYGYEPGWSTVRRWVDDEYRERERIRNATNYRKLRRDFRPETAAQRVERRISELRGIGLSYADVSKILDLDYGIRINYERIRYLCNHHDGKLQARDLGKVEASIEHLAPSSDSHTTDVPSEWSDGVETLEVAA